jgi:D-alanyl-D-alanine carboxypeptidase/D-alanyl-D-alanine-endopeptidase (penicillin-binding protein 4)
MRIIFVLLFFITGCSSPRLVTKELKETENQLHEHVGFYLYDLASKKMLVDYNGSKYFTPASNTKIFTLYTSLKLLEDSIASLKYIKRGDSLIFQGLGDPSFLYKEVFDNGRTYKFLKEQPGNLFFASGNFQTKTSGAGWAWDDYNEDYSSERSAFPIYGNLISIQKSYADKFLFQPKLFSKDFTRSNEFHSQNEIIRNVHSNHLTYFDGKRKTKKWTIPFLTSDSLTVKLLSDTLHRQITKISWPRLDSAKIFKSIPLDSLYSVMMKTSDNFIAEQLLLQCAAVVSDTLKPEIAIRYSTKNFLSDLPDKPLWVDGSGLSRYNQFTPRSIVFIWNKIYGAVPQDRLFKLLAIGGEKGTLKNYFKSEVPYVFGKSGALGNVHIWSGFLITRKGKIFTFSFMNNNFITTSSDVRKRMEKIINRIREKY